MAMTKYREMAVDELKNELVNLKREYLSLRVQRGVGQANRPHLFKQVRKNIAQILTALVEKKGASS